MSDGRRRGERGAHDRIHAGARVVFRVEGDGSAVRAQVAAADGRLRLAEPALCRRHGASAAGGVAARGRGRGGWGGGERRQRRGRRRAGEVVPARFARAGARSAAGHLHVHAFSRRGRVQLDAVGGDGVDGFGGIQLHALGRPGRVELDAVGGDGVDGWGG